VGSQRDRHQGAAVPFPAVPLRQRVAQIRYDVNWQGTAVRMQYERLVAHLNLSLEDMAYAHLRGIVDMDFLVIAVRRLLRVAERARDIGCDVNGELKQAIKIFTSQWGQVIDVRNALEHIDHGRAGIVPVQGGGTLLFAWRGEQVDVHKLFRAADNLCKTICRVIEPQEANDISI
jgi:hypothetical protein